jgi:hypothetical protein
VTDLGDYEQVQGVYLPFAQESGRSGSTERQKVQYDTADANPDIPEDAFRLPAAAAPAR